MKAYGKPRHDCTNRNRKGTSRPCPCCEPPAARRKNKVRVYKRRARAEGKKEAVV